MDCCILPETWYDMGKKFKGDRSMEIRSISKIELPVAMALVWKVFLEFEAPDYSPEGVATFKEYIDGQAENMTFEVYGAFEKDDARRQYRYEAALCAGIRS